MEVCRQLGDALVAAWQHHGGKHVIPPDEDELLHARRLVAQRCLYGVDRNPMAIDLTKLSLWLATLAKDHPFTFLDHSLRMGDALVGLSKKQVLDFHWETTATRGQDRGLFGQQGLESAIDLAISFRREILEGGDFLLPEVKAERLKRADGALDQARRAGDLCLAAFFNGDKPKHRAALRERYLDTLVEVASTNPLPFDKIKEVEGIIAHLRKGAPHSVTPFHWEIEFPEVFARQSGGFDAFIGNPPFVGGKKISTGSGDSYLAWLLMCHDESDGGADLVAHFFRRCFYLARAEGTIGFIATNTIRQGDTRHTGLRWICVVGGGTIYSARRRYKWPGEAAVVVSIVWIRKGAYAAQFDLDGTNVPLITAFLFHDGGHENPASLRGNEGKSFIGSFILGMGFTFDDTDKKGIASSLAEMRRLIAKDPNNADRIFPYLGGEEVNDSPTHTHHRFTIDFSDFPQRRSDLGCDWAKADERQRDVWLRTGVVPEDYPHAVAADWPDLLEVVSEKVKPERTRRKTDGSFALRDPLPIRWWHYADKRPGLYRAIARVPRVLVQSQVSTFVALAFAPTRTVFSHGVDVFVIPQYSGFGILQSRANEVWVRFFASSLEDRLRYTPSDCFETFPFPIEWETDAVLEAVGREYYEARAALMVSHHEGMTKTYNRFHDPDEDAPGIHRLRCLHAALDHAVLAAYGWGDLVETGSTTCEFLPEYYDEPAQEGGAPIPKNIRYRWPDATRDEVLARLLKLNAQRHAEELVTRRTSEPKTAVRKRPIKTVRKKKAAQPIVPTSKPQLPDEIRYPSPSADHYAIHLITAILSARPNGVSLRLLRDAFVAATRPSILKDLALPDDKTRAAQWQSIWNEAATPGDFIPTLKRMGSANLAVEGDGLDAIIELQDGAKQAPTAFIAYDAWLALHVIEPLSEPIPLPEEDFIDEKELIDSLRTV